MLETLRSEYPRPQFVRDEWMSLNGMWEFAFDDADEGFKAGWDRGDTVLPMAIRVPFPYQTELSGIGTEDVHDIVWYRRTFTVPEAWQGQRVKLHFGAVDYESQVWVNGRIVATNRGGYVPFSADITNALVDGENTVVLRVVDTDSIEQPRGKQKAKVENWGCWYTRVTGIWQSVWLEPVHDVYVKHVKMTPDIDAETLTVAFEISETKPGLELELAVSHDGTPVLTENVALGYRDVGWVDRDTLLQNTVTLSLPDAKLWTPENPHLYDLHMTLRDGGTVTDEVKTYFGMRKVSTDGRTFLLNNEPYYLRMVLDQGYWADGIYTPTDVKAFQTDVQFMKQAGLNGVRKHQKVEDPYFYHYCDVYGLVVWDEMPSPYDFSAKAVDQLVAEWQRVVERDYNHPSIVAWVPFNESWGLDPLRGEEPLRTMARHHIDALYHLTKALDPTRLCVGNDGWEQSATDIITIHEYTQDHEDLTRRYRAFLDDMHSRAFSHNRPILLPKVADDGQPLMITEFGGCRVEAEGKEGWGYGEAVQDFDGMEARIKELVDAIYAEPTVYGFCYTQLTDVQQEVNGLMDENHNPKIPAERLAKAFGPR